MPRQFTKAAEMRNYIIRFLYPLCVIEFDEILDLMHSNPKKYQSELKDFVSKNPERGADFMDYVMLLTKILNVFRYFGEVPTVRMKIKLYGAPEMYTVEDVCLQELADGSLVIRVLLDK